MVDRLFQIVYLLMEKPRMTAKELAERFEVSERTIYRDLDKLTLAGIPVYTNQGRNGGISILPDYVLDKAVLTVEEKSKILEALNALGEVVFEDEKTATEKLKDFLGDEYQDWIEIEFSSWGNSKADGEMFRQIKDAILQRRYLEITYSGYKQVTLRRKIKPLKLCFKDQAWYLYAYCCLRKDYRFFKLKRISEIKTLDSYFAKEKTGKVLKGNCGEGKEANHGTLIHVKLLIKPQMAFRAYDDLPNVTATETGELICEIDVTEMEWFLSYVLSYGPYIRVIEPDEVKERVKQAINEMGEIY